MSQNHRMYRKKSNINTYYTIHRFMYVQHRSNEEPGSMEMHDYSGTLSLRKNAITMLKASVDGLDL